MEKTTAEKARDILVELEGTKFTINQAKIMFDLVDRCDTTTVISVSSSGFEQADFKLPVGPYALVCLSSIIEEAEKQQRNLERTLERL
jgi:hypothetical protein